MRSFVETGEFVVWSFDGTDEDVWSLADIE